MSHRIFSQPSTAPQRVARAVTNSNEPTVCRTCGSLYFMEVPAQMYSMGSYGVRSVSITPVRLIFPPSFLAWTKRGR
jgi:hypothetical protein